MFLQLFSLSANFPSVPPGQVDEEPEQGDGAGDDEEQADPEAVEDTLWAEVASMKDRHKFAAKFWADMGGFSPTIGIIGTVLGLIHTMENLSEPAKLGPLIASAFIFVADGIDALGDVERLRVQADSMT